MGKIILPEVELCAIVRDELINPAGGIEDFVHSTTPFVGRATIVDTGSKDGTKEKLRNLLNTYPRLNIGEFDQSMKDAYIQYDPRVLLLASRGIGEPDSPDRFSYAAARNFAVSLTKLRWLLVLDADERLTQEDFKKIGEVMRQQPTAEGFNFDLGTYTWKGGTK